MLSGQSCCDKSDCHRRGRCPSLSPMCSSTQDWQNRKLQSTLDEALGALQWTKSPPRCISRPAWSRSPTWSSSTSPLTPWTCPSTPAAMVEGQSRPAPVPILSHDEMLAIVAAAYALKPPVRLGRHSMTTRSRAHEQLPLFVLEWHGKQSRSVCITRTAMRKCNSRHSCSFIKS